MDLIVRATDEDEIGVTSLAMAIAEDGLLEPLSVVPVGRGVYEVISGRRRLLAISMLVGDGVYVPDHERPGHCGPARTVFSKVPCRIIPGRDD